MTDQDKKNIADIRAYLSTLKQLDPAAYQKNSMLIELCFEKAIQIIENNAAEAEKQANYIASMEEIKERYPDTKECDHYFAVYHDTAGWHYMPCKFCGLVKQTPEKH